MLLQSPGGLGFGMPYEKPGLGTEAAVVVAAARGRGWGSGQGGGWALIYLYPGKERQPGGRASWGKQHPMVQSPVQAVSLKP